MTASVRRVTVVGSSRRLDLAVPGGAPVAELLPEVVALAGEPVDPAALPRWVLATVEGGDLAAGASLESAGVLDGTVLYLRRLDEPLVGLQGFDLVERATAGGEIGFPPATDRVVLAGAAAVLLVVTAGLLLRDARPAAALAAALLALCAVTGARRLQAPARAALTARNPQSAGNLQARGNLQTAGNLQAGGNLQSARTVQQGGPEQAPGGAPAVQAGTPTAAAVLALTAGPLLGVAAAIGAAQAALPGGSGGHLAVGLGGAALGGLLAAAAIRAARPPGTALAAVATVAALAVLLAQVLTAEQAAGLNAVAAVLAVPVLPRLVLRLCGLRLSDLDRASSASPLQLDKARRALPWALAAAGALVVAAAVVLARGSVGAQLPLAAVCGFLLVLRSRQRRGAAEVLPLAIAGQLALVVTGAGLALTHPRSAGPLIVLVAIAAVYAAAAGLPSAAVDRPRWAQRRRRLEAAALVAVVPLLIAVLGGFGVVIDLARGAE